MVSLCSSVAEHPMLAWSSITSCLDLVIMNCLLSQDVMRDLAFVTVPILSYQRSIQDPLLYLNTESTVTFLETSFTILNRINYLFLLNCVSVKAHTTNFSNNSQYLQSTCYVPRSVK